MRADGTTAFADDRFSGMGTTVHVRTVGGGLAVGHRARALLSALERRWSRFLPDSDVSRLNRNAGASVAVEPETILLLQRAIAAAKATDGRYDPTVGAALVAHGYDRTFTEVSGPARQLEPAPVVDASWPAIEIDPASGTACLPPDTSFDPGGIGKGLAADLIAEELASQVDGVLVNIGGDARLCGTSGDPAGWVITIDDPFRSERELTRLALPEGAVATSSKLARRWETAKGPAHHIIDPRTGRPAASDVAAVTVIAAEAWWAEAQATSLFLQGAAGLRDVGDTVEALVIFDDGRSASTPGLAGVLR